MITPVQDLAPARQERLRAYLQQAGVARVEQLGDALGVSPATVRRDLDALEAAGCIRRVHGGAVWMETRLDEPLFDEKTGVRSREKQAIARSAAARIGAGETIYLDGGSTVLELARLLVDRTDITVATNSLRAAMELAGEGPRMILLGGELRRLSQTLVGPLTRPLLDTLRLDWAFMGTIGLDREEGLTTTDPSEAYTKERVMSRAARVALMCDASKLNRSSFARSGRLEDVDVLIVDGRLDSAWRKALRRAGVQAVTV